MEPDCYLQEHSFGAGTVPQRLHAHRHTDTQTISKPPALVHLLLMLWPTGGEVDALYSNSNYVLMCWPRSAVLSVPVQPLASIKFQKKKRSLLSCQIFFLFNFLPLCRCESGFFVVENKATHLEYRQTSCLAITALRDEQQCGATSVVVLWQRRIQFFPWSHPRGNLILCQKCLKSTAESLTVQPPRRNSLTSSHLFLYIHSVAS